MKKKPRRSRPKANKPRKEATAAAFRCAPTPSRLPIRYAPPASAAGERFADLFASYAHRIERRAAFLADGARRLPAEVGARAGRLRAGAHAAARTYSRDEREALALLFLPFLLVASAMVVHQSVRMLQNYLTAIAIPDEEVSPLLPGVTRDVRIAAVPQTRVLEAPPARTDLAAISRAPENRAITVAGAALTETPAASTSDARAVVASDIGRPLSPEDSSTKLVSAPFSSAPPAREEMQFALLGPIGDMGRIVPQRAPEPVETLEVDDNGKPIRPGICAIDQAPRSPAALPLGETVSLGADTFGQRLARAAEAQTASFVIYNDAYRTISYPMGDVNGLFGVCTDVIVRAYRALGLDLQALVQEARAGTGDRSIDHRRTEILRRFFSTQGESLPITSYPEDYRPGDIVSYYRPQNRRTRAHIAIVSSVMAPSGRLMIVHNRGWGPELEDALFVDQITGHYRYRGPVQTRNADSDSATRPPAWRAKAPVHPAAFDAGRDAPRLSPR